MKSSIDLDLLAHSDLPPPEPRSPIEQAFAYVEQRVLTPALAHPTLAEALKARVSNSRKWLMRFERVGDLLIYLRRFKSASGSQTYDALKAEGLLTFEDVVGPFEERFSTWADERTTPNTFVVGKQYDSFQILIFARAYDTRAGGMFLLGTSSAPDAVVIKATLSGGAYANAWLQPKQRLKYYLKSRNGTFGEHFQENAAILNGVSVPILTFVRANQEEDFTYEGVFVFGAIHREDDGSKWFELVRGRDLSAVRPVIERAYDEAQLESSVKDAMALPQDELLKRLADEPKRPRKFVVQSVGFVRSALVIAAVLGRAGGKCEDCQKPAPFLRKKDGSPYLEVHHRVRLADDGEDTLENAVALCPNCHRQGHYG